MIINSYTEWDELKAILIGDIKLSSNYDGFTKFHYPYDPSQKLKGPIVSKIAERVKTTIDNVCEVLDKRNIKIYKPDTINSDQKISTPWFETDLITPTLNVQDRLGVIGNKFINYSLTDDLALLPFTLTNFYTELYKEHNDIFTFPKVPDDLVWDENDEILNDVPYLEGANILKCGDVIFCTVKHSGNNKGIEMLQKIIGSEFTLVPIRKVFNHLDAHINFVNDKLMIHDARMDISEIRPWCPPDMKIVPVMYDRIHNPAEVVWPGVQDDDIENTNLLISNTINLDPETVICLNAREKDIKFYKKYDINCLTVDFPEQWMVNFGLHCFTVDLERNGNLRTIFDKT